MISWQYAVPRRGVLVGTGAFAITSAARGGTWGASSAAGVASRVVLTVNPRVIAVARKLVRARAGEFRIDPILQIRQSGVPAVDPGYLKRLLSTWATDFDWAEINRLLSRIELYRGQHGLLLTSAATRAEERICLRSRATEADAGAPAAAPVPNSAERLGNPVSALVDLLQLHNVHLAAGHGRAFSQPALLLDASVAWLWPSILAVDRSLSP